MLIYSHSNVENLLFRVAEYQPSSTLINKKPIPPSICLIFFPSQKTFFSIFRLPNNSIFAAIFAGHSAGMAVNTINRQVPNQPKIKKTGKTRPGQQYFPLPVVHMTELCAQNFLNSTLTCQKNSLHSTPATNATRVA